jgi:hypothetical protein
VVPERADAAAEAEKSGTELARLIEKALLAPDNLGLLQTLLDKSEDIPTEDIRQHIVKAVAAGFIANGATDTYSAMRSQLDKPDMFEASVHPQCRVCKGKGFTETPCPSCKGSGRCSNMGCRQGELVVPRLGGGSITKPCPVCKGQGCCLKCQGEKTLKNPCKPCAGQGGTWLPARALALYDAELKAAQRGIKEMEAAEQKRLQQEQEWKAKREAAEIAREQELIKKYGVKMGTKVFNKEPVIGMTKAMFTDMQLDIESFKKTENAEGTVEVYLCRILFGGNKRIFLTNGKITQIDTEQ